MKNVYTHNTMLWKTVKVKKNMTINNIESQIEEK